MISCARKTHIPSEEASFCCSMSSKWCCRSGWCPLWSAASRLSGLITVSDKPCLPFQFRSVVVRLFSHHRSLVKIMLVRRRGGLPLEACCSPWIRAGDLAIAQRPDKVDHGQQISQRQDRCPRRREHVQHLEF